MFCNEFHSCYDAGMNERQQKFVDDVWEFYRKNRRDLPWRNTTDPYKILVSEVMLQQTQVSRVEKKYPEFLRAFPTVKKLATASTGGVLKAWQGMGYNRRALSLKRAAEIIVREHKGKVPSDPMLLEALPGIGHYTARAICTFAFNAPHVFIETNIRRVYIHHFFPRAQNVPDKKLLPRIEATLDQRNPCEWYAALMDYGSALSKIILNPNRQSKHYVKQKPFKGSNREVRGMIVRHITKAGATTVSGLSKVVPNERLQEVVEALVREGFLKRSRERLTLA